MVNWVLCSSKLGTCLCERSQPKAESEVLNADEIDKNRRYERHCLESVSVRVLFCTSNASKLITYRARKEAEH